MLTLLEKLYGPREADVERAFTKFLSSLTSGLDAEAKFVGKDARNWVKLDVSGDDVRVVENYLRKRFGLVPSLADLRMSMVLRGKIVDSGRVGYGLYVDIGLSNSSHLDVLVPLHKLRSNLAEGRRLPLREMIDIFCLHDNFPLSIHLTELDFKGKKIGGEPSDSQVELFRGWLSTNLDRVIVLGAYREQVMLALRRSGLWRYIARVDGLGFLEHSLMCKLGTDAPGVVNALGRYLPEVPLHAFSPKKVNNTLGGFPSPS